MLALLCGHSLLAAVLSIPASAAITQALQSLTLPTTPSDYADLGNEEIGATLSYERSRLSALQSELQERGAEIDLLRNEQPQLKLATAEAELAEIENLTFAKKNSSKDATFEARTVANRARKIAAIPAIVREYLEENKQNTTALVGLISRTGDIEQGNLERNAELSRLNKAYGILTEQLRVAGYNISPGLAIALRKERDSLAALVSIGQHWSALVDASSDPDLDLQQRIIDGRLKQIEQDSFLTQNERTAVANLLVRSPGDTGDSEQCVSTIHIDTKK